jgi:hypothetical protein
MEWEWDLPTSRSDDRWRRGRKILDRGLRPSATSSRWPMLQMRARVLLSRLLTGPQQWEAHFEVSVEIHAISRCIPKLFVELLAFREKQFLP